MNYQWTTNKVSMEYQWSINENPESTVLNLNKGKVCKKKSLFLEGIIYLRYYSSSNLINQMQIYK